MKFLKSFLKLLGAAGGVFLLFLFCESQTQGFRPYLLLSNLPNDPRWEVPPLDAESEAKIDTLLNQPFTFLGAGGWCIAFLGADEKTVLKFFRHSQFLPTSILKEFSFEKLLLKTPPLPEGAPYFQEFNFKSCILLYKEAKERTGILYLHLNKTKGRHKPVLLIDNIGVHHHIDLDATEFIVQEKAELILSRIDTLAKEEKWREAEQCIDEILSCLIALYQRGIKDYDRSFRHNFGFIGKKAITLDLSSFGHEPAIANPTVYTQELVLKTQRLERFLRKKHPELHPYYKNRLSSLSKEIQKS